MSDSSQETATFAAGCFWCTEAVFERLKGVSSVTSGYAGGHTPRPTYEEVSTGKTGYAEAVQITFDPSVISYEQLLDVFWSAHDPTTPNRQGPDVGPQYRSAIFAHSEAQRRTAVASKERLRRSGKFRASIVTEIVPFTSFTPAEEAHQDYYAKHRGANYCQLIIDPKLTKLQEEFPDAVRD